MFEFLLFYLLVIPLSVLLHEVGHGLGVVLFSKSNAHIYLGVRNEENKENFRLGRLHFHILWSFIGFVYWAGDLSKRQRAIALAGGPMMSLLLTMLFFWIAVSIPNEDLRPFFWGITSFNCIQFIATIIPIQYPRWWVGYSGHPSDGLQILRLFRSNP